MDGLEKLRHAYQEINESFSKTIVFHCGASAGIFSEINCMIGFMAYCLKHEIRFTLYSDDANFSQNGWQAFFQPFCQECHETFHHHYNHRLPYLSEKNELLKLLQFLPKQYLKRKYHFDYLTYELWDKVITRNQSDDPLQIPELGMNGTIRDAVPILLRIIWNFNEQTRSEIDQLMKPVLPETNFAGIQLRFGDKKTEAEIFEASRYLDLLNQHSDLRKAFIMTDDYETGFRQLKANYPSWEFSTLTPESDHGYSQAVRDRQSETEKRSRFIMLFATVEILIRSKIFCGMLSSNPSRFVWMAKNYRDCLFVDESHTCKETIQ